MESANRSGDQAALRMIDLFTSVGAQSFDLTRTNLKEEHAGNRHNIPAAQLIRRLPAILDEATRLQHSIIVRPRAGKVAFIQLDDLSEPMLERVRPVALFALQTSPRGRQAWIALDAPHDRDFTRRVRKATGADLMASGATRIAGSYNFKEKYQPDFPQVRIIHSNPGLTVTKERLETLGLVAPPEVFRTGTLRASPTRSGVRKWPSYERCIQGAPLNQEGTGPDRSRADFTWAKTALEWGWSIEDTADRLREVSSKARERDEHYALTTVQQAAKAIERGPGLLKQ
ncbi:MAG TPA: DNA-primase RepB domain-containing protein [Terriglobia bacterium]|nr:DNA-primase RepB domain-containing protein [Terriglobia bacterium]